MQSQDKLGGDVAVIRVEACRLIGLVGLLMMAVLSGCAALPSGETEGASSVPELDSDSHGPVAEVPKRPGHAPLAQGDDGRLQANEDIYSQGLSLVLAARYGQEDKVRTLLMQGVDLELQDDLGYSALMTASAESSVVIQRMLIEQGANVNAKAVSGNTALMSAAAKGYVGHVQRLLDAGAAVDAKNQAGETALMVAIRFGHPDVLAVLLKAGADVNVYTQDEVLSLDMETPLMYAARYGASLTAGVRVVRLLLAQGARPNIHRHTGETAMTIAKLRGYALIVNALRRHGARDESPYALIDRDAGLLKAIKLDDISKVRELLPMVADPDHRDPLTGVTPLLSAAYYGNARIVQLVVERGAELNDIPWGLRDARIETSNVPVVDRDLARRATHGDTPLVAAIRYGHNEAAAVLLNHGARPELPNRDNETPGLLAARNGMATTMALLLDKGLDPDLDKIPEIDGYSVANIVKRGRSRAVLLEAAGRGYEAVVAVLLKAGANPDIRDEEGRTALFGAASQGYRATVDTLLAHHADPDLGDEHGMTPLMLAAKSGYLQIARALLAHGADVNAIDGATALRGGWSPDQARRSGHSALIFAARGGHIELVRLLLSRGAITGLHTNRGERAVDIARRNGFSEVAKLFEQGSLQAAMP